MGKGSSAQHSRVEVLRGGTIAAQGDGTVVDKANSASASPANSTLDVTTFSDTGINNLDGLQEGDMTIEGVEDPADAGQDELNAAVDEPELIDVAFWPDERSGRGVRGKVQITDFTNDSETDSSDSFSVTGQLADGQGFEVL